ncbi:MAG: beta-ketoacyl synthase chain length factor [Deltaproteobacteria bacterium]|nr:beta-ketoacyl synthase chain length factor [Deltaproteobacteria bacterium]
MMRAAILGLGQLSAAGAGIGALRSALARGVPIEPTRLPCTKGGPRQSFQLLRARTEGTEDLVPPRAARRLDDFSLRALCAAELALADAGFAIDRPERVGVIVATGWGAIVSSFGFLDAIIDKGDSLASPVCFAQSVHNAPASIVSATLGATGPILTVTGFSHAWPRALWIALDWIERGSVDLVLLGSAEQMHEGLASGLMGLGGWSEQGELRPLDLDRASYVPGETYTAMLLGRPARAERPAKWGTVDEPIFFRDELPPGDDEAPLFLAACGDPREAEGYRRVVQCGAPVAAYGALWGANPTADALTVMAAAASLQAGMFYASPRAETASAGLAVLPAGPCGPGPVVRCCTIDGAGAGVVVAVRADSLVGQRA